MWYLKHLLVIGIFLSLAACGGSSSSSTPSPAPTPVPPTVNQPSPVPPTNNNSTQSLNGRLTFDFVPHSNVGSLDYDNIAIMPIRGATVQLLSESGSVLASDSSDENGAYSFDAPSNTNVQVRVLAELREESGDPSWRFQVTDNTNNNAQYVLDGGISNTGTSASTRDLHAASGWNGTVYSGTRAAAPFAILDAVYDALAMLLSVDPDLNLPAAELRWSINNVPVEGDRTIGEITTSFYDPNIGSMYILGSANNDIDEYDRSVIQHEFAHYLEDNISRADNIGGAHSLNSILDMRIAFGEGFANAFTGIIDGNGVYEDAFGASERFGSKFSVESNNVGNFGWYSENSVQKIIYDIVDTTNETNDNISLGFGPIYDTLTSSAYINSSALTSIFLFVDELKKRTDATEDLAIDALLNIQNINGSGPYGEGETNNAGVANALPLYTSLAVGDTLNICSSKTQGEHNGSDVRSLIRINIPVLGSYTFSFNKTSGTAEQVAGAILYKDGIFRNNFNNIQGNSRSVFLRSSGEYILDFYEQLNADFDNATGGEACFDIRVEG